MYKSKLFISSNSNVFGAWHGHGYWTKKPDAFLQFNEHEILTNTGEINAKLAREFASEQYENFRKQQLNEPKKDDFYKFLEEGNE